MRLVPWLLAAALGAAPARGEVHPSRGPIPLRGDGSSWMVHATINGRAQGLFLVDTGASYCVIAPELARELAVRPTGSFATIQTANGVVRAPVVQLRVVALGDTHARDVQALVHDAVGPQLDGVIGLNLLNRYRYAIDPRRRTLELQ
jgi:clan AA aspartic protease (TIGR02281 family)